MQAWTLLWAVAAGRRVPLGGCPLGLGHTFPDVPQDSPESGVHPNHSCHLPNAYHVLGSTSCHSIRKPNDEGIIFPNLQIQKLR